MWNNLPVFIICGVIAVVIGSDDEYEGLYSLSVEHSFDSGNDAVFTRRGTVTIHSVKAGIAEYTADSSFSEEDKLRLKDLAQSDGFYRIRVRKNADSQQDSRTTFVYSFMKACALYESGLSDQLTIHVDQSGNLLAVSLSPTVPYCSGAPVGRHQLNHFNTTVSVQQTANGPAPETQAYIQKIEQEKQEKAKGQQADNRGFFAKYWMYIVPVLIFFMFTQNMDPQGGGGAARS